MDDIPNRTLRVLQVIQADLSGLRDDISEIRGDISGLRGDISEIRGDISGLRGDVSSLRSDMNAGFAGVNSRIDGVIEIVGRHHGELEARVTRIEQHLELR